MFKYIPAALVATALMFGAGCGDDDDDDSGVSGEQIDFTHELAKAICLAGRDCCEKDDLDINEYCVKDYEIELAQSVPTEPSDAIQWDSAAATKCIEAMRTLYSHCTYDETDIDATVEECDFSKLGKGTLAKGKTCTYSMECAGDSKGNGACLDGSSWGGTQGLFCYQVLLLKEGDNCSDPVPDSFVYSMCDEGLLCDFTDVAPLCVKAPVEGEPCYTSCAKGFYCYYPPDYSVQAICKSKRTSGSCENDSECVYDCVDGQCTGAYRVSDADSMCEDSAQTGGAP